MKLGAFLMMGGSMTSCAELPGSGNSTNRWQEEVLLHDGQKIVVDRLITRSGRREPGQKPNPTDVRLSFTMPGTNKIVLWDDKKSDDVGNSNFRLLLLDILDGRPYLVTSPLNCLSYNKWGRPDPPYVVFWYESGAWARIPFSELPEEFISPNLVVNSPEDAAKKHGDGVITAEEIAALNSKNKQPENVRIQREPIANTGASCPQMVHYKCGWVGTNADGTFNKEFMDRMCK